MTRFLFDTNILIDEVDGDDRAYRELSSCDEAYVSRIVWMELLVGAKQDALPAIHAVLRSLVLLELNAEVAVKTVSIRHAYPKLRLPDAMIYATAQVYGLTLVTRNTRDFQEEIPGIRIPYTV